MQKIRKKNYNNKLKLNSINPVKTSTGEKNSNVVGSLDCVVGENQSDIVEGVMFGLTTMRTPNPLQQENLTLPVSS